MFRQRVEELYGTRKSTMASRITRIGPFSIPSSWRNASQGYRSRMKRRQRLL
ncbi:hypothetical protein EMCG_02145 [[Emmonsia] crescens]|uniref:Uncharacterized protein n=1 Tax=[Emmonsia] crescens TaxID=73230 RepID=A0A0G2I0B5_9EURO|nr:hypothetical protein EMCG_02145 [Emmonsia crescens UAMH 3008]